MPSDVLSSRTQAATLYRVVQYRPTLDLVFGALADPTRRTVLDRLATGPATVSTLAEPLEMTLPGVLKHVRILEEAALVTTRKVGRERICALAPSPLDDVAQWVMQRQRRWDRLLDRFAIDVGRGRGPS